MKDLRDLTGPNNDRTSNRRAGRRSRWLARPTMPTRSRAARYRACVVCVRERERERARERERERGGGRGGGGGGTESCCFEPFHHYGLVFSANVLLCSVERLCFMVERCRFPLWGLRSAATTTMVREWVRVNFGVLLKGRGGGGVRPVPFAREKTPTDLGILEFTRMHLWF